MSMEMIKARPSRHGGVRPRRVRRVRRTAVALLTVAVLTGGVVVSTTSPADATPADATTWLGGVHYTHVFHKWSTAWDFFLAGRPTENGYNRMVRDCRAMGGASITKAGTGSISGDGSGYTTVTFDYSCWR